MTELSFSARNMRGTNADGEPFQVSSCPSQSSQHRKDLTLSKDTQCTVRISTASDGHPLALEALKVGIPADPQRLLRDVQLSFLRQLFHLKKSVTPAIIFRELAEKPWVHTWWSQALGFMHHLSLMP